MKSAAEKHFSGSTCRISHYQKKYQGQRTRFTIRELIRIFEVTQEFPSKKNKNQVYWQKFIKIGVFPGRSVNSVNAQWQRFCHYDTVEQAIHKAYQLAMPYSTSFPQLPINIRESFESRHLQVKGENGSGTQICQSHQNIGSFNIHANSASNSSYQKTTNSDFAGPYLQM